MLARPTVLALLAALLPLAGAGPGTASVHVHMEDIAFDPATVTILVGEGVDWDNHDLFTHTVTANDASWDSGDVNSGGAFARAFGAAGTFPYHCKYHAGMDGKVVVSDPTALPDLVVAGIESVDLIPGVTKQLNVTVRNLGLAKADASVLGVAYLYQGGAVPIADVQVPLLGPFESQVLRVEWRVLGKVGDFTVQATVDASQQVGEANEANNMGTATVSVLVAGIPGIDLLDPV